MIGGRELMLLDAPSNLGLRPPVEGTVPGCYKAPGALRDNDLLNRLGATEAGVLTPPRYHTAWQQGHGVRNAEGIAEYSRRLAARIDHIRRQRGFPVVLGGDCSIVLGAALALRREGRFGLAYLDGHDDFRHPGIAPTAGSAAAGECLALATGRGAPELTGLDGLWPYVADSDVVLLGAREEESAETAAAGIRGVTSQRIMVSGTAEALALASETLGNPELDGFWIHVDIDVLDPSVVSAVDSPDPGGLDVDTLVTLLRGLLDLPGAAGFELTVFDPDLDPDGTQAAVVAEVIERAFARRA
ncbi:arginase family protein [Amycolatopsis cihanbeyliensis]|uniref:Arginase n=1 Tax=Amycolatopsis cihanbeyliensis TaxID=1128664 RepID=A0A542CUQ7_AMYCI|nr:arginase family protein [Amycolatopsis cihanbeyliensis]TQI94556.1 arginase [Amycolatopsis cihanbeyliensis]